MRDKEHAFYVGMALGYWLFFICDILAELLIAAMPDPPPAPDDDWEENPADHPKPSRKAT